MAKQLGWSMQAYRILADGWKTWKLWLLCMFICSLIAVLDDIKQQLDFPRVWMKGSSIQTKFVLVCTLMSLLMTCTGQVFTRIYNAQDTSGNGYEWVGLHGWERYGSLVMLDWTRVFTLHTLLLALFTPPHSTDVQGWKIVNKMQLHWVATGLDNLVERALNCTRQITSRWPSV